MRYSSLTLLTVCVVASQVAGSVIEARSSLEFIFKRQLTDQGVCTTECSTFQNALDVCTTAGCMCTRAVAISLNSCVNCYYQNTPSSGVLDAANELIGSYGTACDGVAGLPPASVTTRGGGGGLPTATTTSATTSTTPRVTVPDTTIGPNTTVEPPTSRTTIRPPTTTADGAETTVTAPNSSNSGNSGNSGGGLPGLSGSGAQSLSAGVYPVVVVVALAMGAFAL
ncbi:hypothetical protein EST38_g11258 [Candolleomyces aberdarensis]|uniref:Uncharacterized protein n=1 Tax=Candolleomyces aberdarensis TaxID=2316362 RepID=A0A4Q2D5B0_9AGAR|nr:hypothetical protein EST38_g11258 [Candolleomyces aberdarensis]